MLAIVKVYYFPVLLTFMKKYPICKEKEQRFIINWKWKSKAKRVGNTDFIPLFCDDPIFMQTSPPLDIEP